MKDLDILVVGGGIGGLTSAIALRRAGFTVTIIEKDPEWSVYGVGIIQQSNVVRAMSGLGLLDDYIHAGFGFDRVDVFSSAGEQIGQIPSPKLVERYPANVGIGRRALQKVLADRARQMGTQIRLGMTIAAFTDDATGVTVRFSNGEDMRVDMVIGADGLYSQLRPMLFPDAPRPRFTGQAVWRYNFPRPADLDCLRAFEGTKGIGLVPLSNDLMYMYVTTPAPGNPFYPKEGMARMMRAQLAGQAPQIEELAGQITDDEAVVYKPLEYVLVESPWYKGHVVLLGDAVHATTPHLGQGAGMAIEDSIVLAEELVRHEDLEDAFAAYQARRFERCKYIVDSSAAVSLGQIGLGPYVDQRTATGGMYRVISEPI